MFFPKTAKALSCPSYTRLQPSTLSWRDQFACLAEGTILISAIVQLINGMSVSNLHTPFARRPDRSGPTAMLSVFCGMTALPRVRLLIDRRFELIPAFRACVVGPGVVLAAAGFAWGFPRPYGGNVTTELSGIQ